MGGPNVGGTASQAAGSSSSKGKTADDELGAASGVVDPIGVGNTPGVTRGKYILIEVPNFNDSDSDPMSSYLRLGAVKDVSIAGLADAPKESGEDLASYVTSFIDDTRVRAGCDATGEFSYIDPAVHAAESAILHTKGGWRDHSDGNRITTTRGDKVEVIRGNYKMVVLSRTDREDDAIVTDFSGGHGADSPITFRPGYENHIMWVPNYDGTWKVTETTVRGDVNSTYHGDTVDTYYGNIKTSTTGSEAPAKYLENPTITDRTWAVAIASYTGSAALPVPTMTDETWATLIQSNTTATTMLSTTEVVDMTDITVAANISSTTTAATVTDMSTVGLTTSTTIGNSVTTVIGSELTTNIGPTTEITVGSTSEITVGAETSLTVGATVDIQVAAFLSLALSGGVDISVGPQLSIGVFQVSWNPLCHEIESWKTSLSQAKTEIGQVYTHLANVIFFA